MRQEDNRAENAEIRSLVSQMRYSKKLDGENYIALLEKFISNPTSGRLKSVLDPKNIEIAADIHDANLANVATAAVNSILESLTDGNAEKFKVWAKVLNKSLKKGAHPLVDKIIEKSAEVKSDAGVLLNQLLTGKTREVISRTLESALADQSHIATTDQVALLTAIVALQPSMLSNNRKNTFAPKVDTLCDKILSATDEEGAAVAAKQLVDVDAVGRVLLTHARENMGRLSDAVMQAVVVNAQKEAQVKLPFGITLNVPLPTNSLEAMASVVLGVHLQTAGKSRIFLRGTDTARVKPYLLSVLADRMAKAKAIAEGDVSAVEQIAADETAALEERKSRGVRCFLARQRFIGSMFKGFADGRAGRIENRKDKVARRLATEKSKIATVTMAKRMAHVKSAMRLALNISAMNVPTFPGVPVLQYLNPRAAAERLQHRDALSEIINQAFASATPAELPAVVATVAKLAGGAPHYERAVLAKPETFAALTSDDKATDHVAVMKAMVVGIQRAPEALVGYMQALHAAKKLPVAVTALMEAAKKDKVVHRNLPLYAQALGATLKALKNGSPNDPEGFSQADIATLIAPAHLNQRYIYGCLNGIDDFTRVQGAVRTVARAIKQHPKPPAAAPVA